MTCLYRCLHLPTGAQAQKASRWPSSKLSWLTEGTQTVKAGPWLKLGPATTGPPLRARGFRREYGGFRREHQKVWMRRRSLWLSTTLYPSLRMGRLYARRVCPTAVASPPPARHRRIRQPRRIFTGSRVQVRPRRRHDSARPLSQILRLESRLGLSTRLVRDKRHRAPLCERYVAASGARQAVVSSRECTSGGDTAQPPYHWSLLVAEEEEVRGVTWLPQWLCAACEARCS